MKDTNPIVRWRPAAEFRTTDRCSRCNASPEAGEHIFDHAYEPSLDSMARVEYENMGVDERNEPKEFVRFAQNTARLRAIEKLNGRGRG